MPSTATDERRQEATPTEPRGMVWLPRIAAVGFLVVLCLVEFAQLLLPGPWPLRYVAEGDFTRQFYPFQFYAAARLAAGQLPLWDPYILGGQPHLADPQTALFYPIGLLINVVAGHNGLPFVAMEWRAFFDVLLGTLFAYLFVGRLANSRVGGVIGAVTFAFGGYLTSYPLPQLPVLEASIWLPLVLYGLERGLSERARVAASTPWFALAGLGGAALILAGHGQTAMLAVYTIAAYTLVRGLALRRPALPTIGQLLLAGAIALGLSAPQWLPTLTYLPATNRAALSYSAASGGFGLADYAQLLAPGGLFQRSYYVGLLPLLLGFLALRQRRNWGWAALWLVASVLALGGNGPLYPLLYAAHVPGFASFRDQERAAYVAAFAAAVLAGLGAARAVGWAQGKASRHRLTSALVAGIAVGLTLAAAALLFTSAPTNADIGYAPPVPRQALTAALLLAAALLALVTTQLRLIGHPAAIGLLCLLPALNLLGAGANLSRQATDPAPPPAPTAAAYLRTQPGLWRVDTLRDGELALNAGPLMGFSFPRGDDPIVLDRTAALVQQPDRYRVWLLFNVQYVLSHQDPGNGFQKVFAADGLGVYRMLYPLPRAWAVRNVVVAPSAAAAEQATLHTPQPGDTVVLEKPPPLTVQGPSLPRDQHEDWQEVSPERLRLQVSVTDNAILVISQPLAPGWAATLDGRPATLYRADYALMALALPAGTHTISLTYAPPGFRWGIGAAVAAFALLLGALLPSLWRKPKEAGVQ